MDRVRKVDDREPAKGWLAVEPLDCALELTLRGRARGSYTPQP